ncbi:hypothetical protein KJ784_03200, partial [Patescibacteria group bacterium]|nr:hypothetical protein [Patescibacteria group bacterium]
KGFGVYSDSATRYILFYNTDSSTIYDSGTSVMLESVILEKVTLSPTGKSIFFVPPDPTTYINGVNSGSQVFIISSGLYSKNLTVYFSGLIEAN